MFPSHALLSLQGPTYLRLCPSTFQQEFKSYRLFRHVVTGHLNRINMQPISYGITAHSKNRSKQQSKARQINCTTRYTNIVEIVIPVSQVILALSRTSAKSIREINFRLYRLFTHSFLSHRNTINRSNVSNSNLICQLKVNTKFGTQQTYHHYSVACSKNNQHLMSIKRILNLRQVVIGKLKRM